MVDPRMAHATAVHPKMKAIAAIRLNMVVCARLSPPQPQPTSSSWHCQVLFIAKYNVRKDPLSSFRHSLWHGPLGCALHLFAGSLPQSVIPTLSKAHKEIGSTKLRY